MLQLRAVTPDQNPVRKKNCLEKDDTHVTVYLSLIGSKNEPINATRVPCTPGRHEHAWNVTWVPTWPLEGQGIQSQVGTRYPRVGTTAGTTSAPERCHINVYPLVRVHTCQKEGNRGQEHKSRVWHSKKLSFSLLSVSRADHDFTAPLTGPLLRCNNAPSCLALNVSFKVLSYFCQIKRHAFYPTKRWRFSSKKRSDMPCFFRRNLCQIWAYNDSSHPLVPPKTIVSCVNYFWTKQKNKIYWPSTFAQKSDAKRLRWKIKSATIFQNCLFESQQPKQSIDCFVTKMSFVFQHTSIRQPNRYVCTTWRFSKYET